MISFADITIEIGNNLETVVIAFISLLGTLVSGLMIRHRVLKRRKESSYPPAPEDSGDNFDITHDDLPRRKSRPHNEKKNGHS